MTIFQASCIVVPLLTTATCCPSATRGRAALLGRSHPIAWMAALQTWRLWHDREGGREVPVCSDLPELLSSYELASSSRAMASTLLRYNSTSG
jgi:hypothetical protein